MSINPHTQPLAISPYHTTPLGFFALHTNLSFSDKGLAGFRADDDLYDGHVKCAKRHSRPLVRGTQRKRRRHLVLVPNHVTRPRMRCDLPSPYPDRSASAVSARSRGVNMRCAPPPPTHVITNAVLAQQFSKKKAKKALFEEKKALFEEKKALILV